MMSNRLALLAGAAVLAFSMGTAQAAVVTLSNIDALWTNVVGGGGGSVINPGVPATLTQVRWPSTGDQSGYDFLVAPQPITVPVPPSPNSFELGDFTHLNFPIPSGSGIDSVQLRIRADITITNDDMTVTDLGQRVFLYDFDHLETPNGADPCANPAADNSGGCADRVSVGSNPASQQFLIGDTLAAYPSPPRWRCSAWACSASASPRAAAASDRAPSCALSGAGSGAVPRAPPLSCARIAAAWQPRPAPHRSPPRPPHLVA